jgi:hypothetical protein
MNQVAVNVVKPQAYWDRAQRVVRDWKTNNVLPEYEGECLVYLDVEGPVIRTTFFQDGARCWDALPS